MTQTEQSIQITLQLPKELYQQASQTADDEQCRVEDFLSQLMVEALKNHDVYRLWKSESDQYQARLAQEGRLNQSPDEVLSELSKIREDIANELYPE